MRAIGGRMATKSKQPENTSSNPYEGLPKKAFWRPAIADRSMFDIEDLWTPKFRIAPKAPVATFGSCFAQHIGNALKRRRFNWLITEKPPQGLSDDGTKLYNYNIFSARTANIYTTSLLRQWTGWALGTSSPPRRILGEGRPLLRSLSPCHRTRRVRVTGGDAPVSE